MKVSTDFFENSAKYVGMLTNKLTHFNTAVREHEGLFYSYRTNFYGNPVYTKDGVIELHQIDLNNFIQR